MERDLLKSLWERMDARIDRRQMLQALGVSATAAFAAGALPGVASALGRQARGGKSFPVTTVNHLSYQCGPDYVRIRDWYVDLFGAWVSWDNGKQCAIEFGDPKKPEGFYIRSAAAGQKPTIGHFAFGIPNIMAHINDMKVEMERWGLKNIWPDGEHGWISDDPAGYMLNTWVPEKDAAMFPGAARPCKDAESQECKDAYEAGLKNLDKMPKPSGRGFKARYFSNIVLNVPADAIPKERDFYRDLLGMKVIHETPQRVFLRFGGNTLFLEGTMKSGEKPYCNRYGLQIENFDSAKVEAELKRRGLDPQPNTRLAWTVKDPDGMTVDVAAAGFAEELARASRT
jgi:catechol 2,3-dioxygenase-like lactoylglutathione lyase family enzyme